MYLFDGKYMRPVSKQILLKWSNAEIQKLQHRLLSFHSIQMMTSTPKMKMKTRGLFALVEGECDWVVFTGRNYKV